MLFFFKHAGNENEQTTKLALKMVLKSMCDEKLFTVGVIGLNIMVNPEASYWPLGKEMDPLFSKHSSQESDLFSLQPGGHAASAQIAQMLTKNKPLLSLLHFWLMVIYGKTSLHATQTSTKTASSKM